MHIKQGEPIDGGYFFYVLEKLALSRLANDLLAYYQPIPNHP